MRMTRIIINILKRRRLGAERRNIIFPGVAGARLKAEIKPLAASVSSAVEKLIISKKMSFKHCW